MSNFKSSFAADMDNFLEFREALGSAKTSILPHLTKFDDFCAENFQYATTLEREIATKWLSSLSTDSYTDKHASAVRQFGKYLNAIGKAAYVLPDGFARRPKKFTPYIPTSKELVAFFGETDSLQPIKTNPRRHIIAPVIFRLLYTCGLRPNEGRELETKDVNLETGEVTIRRNKQKTERIVVMSEDMLSLCREYDTRRANWLTDGKYFFPGNGNEPYTSGGLHSMLRTCWRKANPDIPEDKLPHFRPYDLRHCFASQTIHRWLDEGKDISAMLPFLRSYMGHENFVSTVYYIHLLPENLIRSAGIDMSRFEALLPEVGE